MHTAHTHEFTIFMAHMRISLGIHFQPIIKVISQNYRNGENVVASNSFSISMFKEPNPRHLIQCYIAVAAHCCWCWCFTRFYSSLCLRFCCFSPIPDAVALKKKYNRLGIGTVLQPMFFLTSKFSAIVAFGFWLSTQTHDVERWTNKRQTKKIWFYVKQKRKENKNGYSIFNVCVLRFVFRCIPLFLFCCCRFLTSVSARVCVCVWMHFVLFNGWATCDTFFWQVYM